MSVASPTAALSPEDGAHAYNGEISASSEVKDLSLSVLPTRVKAPPRFAQ